MDLSDSLLTSNLDDLGDYQVQVLAAPVVSRRGIEHRVRDGEELLPWDRVAFAIAAMVGEPEGVCTIVFDLLIEGSGSPLRVCRLDADPAEDAIPLAAAIADYLGRSRCGPSLLAMATEGSTGMSFADLESFEAASIRLLRKR
jgi:hypothetical protein